MTNAEYHKQLFKVMPLQSVLLAVDAPKYTIVYVNDAYLKITNTTENDIIGKGIFEAFPNNPINPNADEIKILTLSLATTLKTKQPQKTVCQQYNIPIRGTNNFEVRYFDYDNIPILNNNGDVEFLLHTIVDVTDVTKSTKRQLEINRIKSNQDALINGTNNLIWSIDINYCIITANEAYLQIIKAASLITLKEGDSVFIDVFGEELNNKWRDYYTKGLNGQHYTVRENLYNPTSHRNEYQLVSFDPMYNETDEIFGVACYSKDITDDLYLQNRLLHTKTELNNILEASLDVICVVNEDGFFLQVSAAAYTIWGYKPEEMIGKNISDFIYYEDIAKSRSNAANLMAGIKPLHFENRYKHKDGSLIWMEWNASWNEKSKARYGIARDITEFKKNEAALIESEKKYSSLFHTSPQPMWVYNLETLLFVEVNNAAMQHYGYSEDEFLNMTILDIKPEEEREKALEIVSNLKRPQTTIIKGNYKHQKKSGKIIDVEIFNSPLIINNKEFVSVIVNDITEKNLYELKITKAIIQTQENERYEVGTEIHDNVCQILASSKIRFKMLEKVLPETELPKLNAGIEYMDLAFKELRNLSHRLAPSFLSDTSVADACKTLFNSLNIDHECTLVLHIDDEFKALKTSKDFQLNLYRILQEQFRNIVKYSQASIIEIEGFISNKKVYLAITDNGVGFNIADTKSGIGMANMKRRTELFSGQFKIDSSLGNGCKIFIEVPLLAVVIE